MKNGIQKVSYMFIKETKISLLYILETKLNRSTDGTIDLNSSSVLPTGNSSLSPTTSTPSSGTQYVVFCSSKEARVSLME